MKKSFALLMLVALIMAGCGSNTADGVKKDAQETAQKVEQKVDEAKSDATAKVNEVKQDAANVASAAAQKLGNAPADVKGRIIALEGVKPGMTLDEVKQILGEPVSTHDDDEFTFANGLIVETNDVGKVDSVKITKAGIKTPEGLEVGMADSAVKEYCGPADEIDNDDDGEVEYKYYSSDRKSKIVYTTRNGTITEIKCSLND